MINKVTTSTNINCNQDYAALFINGSYLWALIAGVRRNILAHTKTQQWHSPVCRSVPESVCVRAQVLLSLMGANNILSILTHN